MKEQLIYGIHAVEAILKNPRRVIQGLWIYQDIHSSRLTKICALALERKIIVQELSAQQLKQQFGEKCHQGVALKVAPLTQYHETDIETLIECTPDPFILILDGLTDPHNLGACIRTAEASGITMVLYPKDKSATTQNPVVNKVACGAVESIPCIPVTNLARTLKDLKKLGIWIHGAAGAAQNSIWDIDFKGPTAIVVGSEGQGLRRLTQEHCDTLFSLPMLGTVESLNASVATGICLYEALRQRLKTKT